MKTPIEFDYDLWTTEDGKCMVRVKGTGEVTEVDRDVMRLLRAEEKKLRRTYGTRDSSEEEKGDNSSLGIILSLDSLPDDEVKAASWLADSKNYTDDVLTDILLGDFKQTLNPLYLSVFESCIINGTTVRQYAAEHNISKSYVSKIENALKEKLKNFFGF